MGTFDATIFKFSVLRRRALAVMHNFGFIGTGLVWVIRINPRRL
jgi:hypothetical protein